MSALGSVLGAVAGRVILPRIIAGLRGIEPGRWPHPEYGPIIVPRGAKFPGEQPGQAGRTTGFQPPFQLTDFGIFLAFGGLLWYAAKRKSTPELGQEQQELFPGLRRELRLRQEDAATSEDPVEACLERVYGWDLERMRELRDSIAAKQTPDLFTKEEEELTGPEAQLLEQIEECLDRIERQYGSLEAAGLPMIPCPSCSDQTTSQEASPQL